MDSCPTPAQRPITPDSSCCTHARTYVALRLGGALRGARLPVVVQLTEVERVRSVVSLGRRDEAVHGVLVDLVTPLPAVVLTLHAFNISPTSNPTITCFCCVTTHLSITTRSCRTYVTAFHRFSLRLFHCLLSVFRQRANETTLQYK